MNLSEAGNIIRNKLVNTSAVTALVGTKIRPLKAGDEDNYPYVIYESISSPSEQTKDGNAQWYKIRYQISMLATTMSSVVSIAKEIKSALDGASGTIAGFTVQRITFEDERDIFNDNSAIDGVYMLQQDYFITIQL